MTTDATQRPARIPKASDVLAAELRTQILGGGLIPGTSLPSEAELISTRGLSRATVREALRLLESDGLIDIRRGTQGGVRVRHPSTGQAADTLAILMTVRAVRWRDVFEYRSMVEPQLAALAARNATDEQRAALTRAAAHDGENGLGKAHLEFHQLVADAAGNEMLKVVSSAVAEAISWMASAEDTGEWDLPGGHDAHEHIAASIAAGDAEKAERQMRKHLDAFRDRAEKHGRLDDPVLPPSRWRAAGARWTR